MGALSGSRASTEPVSRLGPSGFDPARGLVPTLNDLVRQAFEAQDAFDQWDEGRTYTCMGGRRVVSLDVLCREWDDANNELVEFVLASGEALRDAIATETRRAETENTGSVEDEGAGPKDIAQRTAQ